MVFDPPAALAALMSAIKSETVPAVKLDGTVRSSSCCSVSRKRRCRGVGDLLPLGLDASRRSES
jgi:hypothetical protein